MFGNLEGLPTVLTLDERLASASADRGYALDMLNEAMAELDAASDEECAISAEALAESTRLMDLAIAAQDSADVNATTASSIRRLVAA